MANIQIIQGDYELYGELTSRVVSIIRKEAPAYFRYSIDECFVYLDGMERIAYPLQLDCHHC